MHTVFALLCFVVVIHWLIFPYPSGLLHWHCGNLTIAPVPAKQPWWIWINTSCEFIMNDCITTTKQCTTKPCAYFLGYTVHVDMTICVHSKTPVNSLAHCEQIYWSALFKNRFPRMCFNEGVHYKLTLKCFLDEYLASNLVANSCTCPMLRHLRHTPFEAQNVALP